MAGWFIEYSTVFAVLLENVQTSTQEKGMHDEHFGVQETARKPLTAAQQKEIIAAGSQDLTASVSVFCISVSRF